MAEPRDGVAAATPAAPADAALYRRGVACVLASALVFSLNGLAFRSISSRRGPPRPGHVSNALLPREDLSVRACEICLAVPMIVIRRAKAMVGFDPETSGS